MFEVEGKENSWFSTRQVIKCLLLYLPAQNDKTSERNCLLYTSWLTNWQRFQGAWPDHVWVESSSCCFQGVTEFCSPQGVSDFWPTARDTFSSNRKRTWVGRYDKSNYTMLFKYGKCTRHFRGFLFSFSNIWRRFYRFDSPCIQFANNAIARLGLHPLCAEIISM